MIPPVRWKDPDSAASAELRDVIDYARSQVPDAAQTAAITDAVLRQLPQTVAPAASASALGVGGKLMALVLFAALGGVLGVAWYRESTASPPAQPRAVRPTATHNAPSSGGETKSVADAPVAPTTQQTTVPTQPLPTSSALPAQQRARPHRASVVPAAPAPQEELQLLHAARLARRSSPETALTLLREHERVFPDSALREEREALIIEQLQRVDPAQASARLHTFEARYPRSAYRQRLDAGARP